MLEVRLLGQFDVRRDGTPIVIASRPAQSLLAFLLLSAGIEHRREKLAGLLWPDATEKNARSNLRHALWQLRDAIETKRTHSRSVPHILVDDISIAFNASSKYWLDAAIVQAASATIASADELINALDRYRGELLPGFYDDWAVLERERLRAVFEQRMAQLLERLMEEQRWTEVIENAERWIALGQTPEPGYRALMIAYSQIGDRAKMAASWERLVDALATDLGVEPAEQTRQLFERLKGGIPETSLPSKITKLSLSQAETISTVPKMIALPAGTVTFLFTDIEGSTLSWEKQPEMMAKATKRHEEIVRQAVETHGGFAYKFIGDAFQIAFATAQAALSAAVEAQLRLHKEDWKELTPLRVRMALHTGVTDERGNDYVGPVLNRAARLLSAGHGGQTLLSQTTYDLVRDHVTPTIRLRDLGEYLLKDLARPEHIFQVVANDLPSDFPKLRTLHSIPTNLPLSLTSFVGRKSEIEQVTNLLSTTRMLSLIGPGGIGKTRLAMEIGARLLDRFADGVWLIELAPLTDPELFRQTVAAGLGLRERAGRSIEDVLVEHLRQKHLLLILDNCEHMIDACAQSAAAWLSTSQHLKIIVTSRQALNIGGEMTWLVPALSLPESTPSLEDSTRSEAVQLFIERAQFALPSFRVTDPTLESVAAICRRLDGLALAIELAASRVDMLSLGEIQRGMDHSLQLLTEGNRVASPRHQTLRACLDWSWGLLSTDEQMLFRRLAVFSGAWTLEDAEQVCADDSLARNRVLQILGILVRKSMVTVQAREDESRYRVLETIRIYALERLNESGEAERLSALHRDWFLRLAEEVYAQTRERKVAAQRMTRLSLELDNFRAALDWCRKEAGGAEKGLRLSGALGPFWEKQNALREGRECIATFLELAKNSEDKSARARALHSAGHLAYLQGDHAHAIAFFEQGLEIEPPDPRLLAQIHSNLGEAFYRLLDYRSAAKHLHRAIELDETIQDPVGVAYAQMQLGNVYYETGDLERAVASFDGSLQAFRKADQQSYIATALSNLARVHQDRAEYEPAIQGYLEAIQLYENLDNRYGLCIAYDNLSVVYIDLGNYTEAMVYLDKDIQIAETMGNDFRLAAALGNLAECQYYLGKLAEATETISRALSLVKRVQAPHHEGNIYRIRGQIWAAQGQKEEAQKDFETALGLLEPLNHRVRLARLYRAFGKFLLNESSTRPKGIEHMERAQALFHALGAVKEVERTKTLLLEVNETRS